MFDKKDALKLGDHVHYIPGGSHYGYTPGGIVVAVDNFGDCLVNWDDIGLQAVWYTPGEDVARTGGH